MSSVARIETLIQKLSVADQRIIARHLGARLAERENLAGRPALDEGIRFLAHYGSCPAPTESRGRKLRQRAATTR